ncbi:MAG: UDP-N-acetylmuramoyl-L-alanyl-D-glutamate--2,6-diaminopimelate ligase [Myxococcaceae bacterium]|nr:UDP-N-acetylmuramoyl-L-alanyl-D-glutamate--2,6-diaminopimelate ligase [Myxococcaceae bacterium]MCI0671952.1 UDP-N-acetylmuramoyl-L-alanyl-D-glutamate--2,6-diaminopimelate ligase [Myxococcaceae bacterium]
MKLTDVLAGCGAEQASGGRASADVTGVVLDSRQVKAGDLFVALPGTKTDGAQFVGEAVSRGAVAVLAERPIPSQVPFFVVSNVRQALAIVAANFYGRPAQELTLLGITGTNGKTTTSYLLESIAAAGGATTGLLGTIQYKFAGRTLEAPHTTPDALTLQRTLREMVDAGTDTVVMEVSSHALAQERVHGLSFRAAAFTNLSRDHLDYHKDMEEYFQAKRRLFQELLSPGGVAVVNGDDTYGSRIYNELRGQKRMAWKFSRTGAGEISATDVQLTLDGIRATLKTPAGDIPVRSRLLGPHNLENILAAAGMALGAGFSRRDVQDGIERVARVPGRMERVDTSGVNVLVDYAHTDEALRRALEAARALARGRVLVVFGCGGDRDQGKRPLMGQAAGELADVAVVTSDNPRGEDPEDIISQVTPGLEKAGVRRMSPAKARSGEKGYLVEGDRSAAIQLAVGLARPEDVVLIAGKGHEAYQQVGAEKLPFDDREEAVRAARALPQGA